MFILNLHFTTKIYKNESYNFPNCKDIVDFGLWTTNFVQFCVLLVLGENEDFD